MKVLRGGGFAARCATQGIGGISCNAAIAISMYARTAVAIGFDLVDEWKNHVMGALRQIIKRQNRSCMETMKSEIHTMSNASIDSRCTSEYIHSRVTSS